MPSTGLSEDTILGKAALEFPILVGSVRKVDEEVEMIVMVDYEIKYDNALGR